MADDNNKRTRLQLDFSPEALQRLEEIREKVGAKNNAEVVRGALRLYDWLLDQKKAGARILLYKDGEEDNIREVEFLFLP